MNEKYKSPALLVTDDCCIGVLYDDEVIFVLSQNKVKYLSKMLNIKLKNLRKKKNE